MTGAAHTLPAQPYALPHALAYAAQGWPVLALAPGEKRPSGALALHGFRDATTDPATITQWFAQVPGAGVGIYPGPAGLLVLDLDDKPGQARGADSLVALEAQHGELPATLVQRTPSGGQARHLVFALPPGFDASRIGNTPLAPGVDVRCWAGYIGAEPTRVRLIDGREGGYAFDDWDVRAGEVPEVAEAPAWLLGLLTRQAAAPGAAPAQPDTAAPREFATAQQVAELRSALNALDADDYATWVACGHALRGLGATGRELWLSWSQQSAKWKPGDAQRWHGFAAEHAGFRAIFARAQAAGWVNPASRAAGLPAQVPSAASAGQGPGQPAAPAAPWRVVPVADLDAAELAPQAWAWQGYVPAGQVTLLGAHGGAGKSTLALMLAVSVALGLPLFGVPTTAAPVVFFSAEDGADTVRLRLRSTLRTLGVEAAHLAGRLLVLDASDVSPELAAKVWEDDGQGRGRPVFGLTTAGAGLRDMLAGLAAPLLIVDNASDVFGGDENERRAVRAFVRLLAGMVRKQRGAVLLLAHLDKAGARGFGGGESYSGSTAWHNSARSRLFLEREKDGPGLELRHEKSNFGPRAEPLRLVWPRDGLPQVDEPVAGIVRAIATDNATRALLRLVHEFTQRGEFVSTATTSRTHAGRLLRLAPGFPAKLSDPAVFELLRGAERKGWIERVSYRGADRKPRERWQVTQSGCTAAEIAATAATAATLEVTAPGAAPAEPAATAATSPPGGVGGRARTEVAAEVAAPEAGELPETAGEAAT